LPESNHPRQFSESNDLRADAREIFRDALGAVDTRRAVLDAVEIERTGLDEGARLRVGGAHFDLREREPAIYSVAIGKAAAAMAAALDEMLGARLAGGVISAPASRFTLSNLWRVFEGGHPLPNEASFEAARAAFELLDRANEARAPVVFLVSGGGSAMIEWPRDERLTLEDLREANRVLVGCGASIGEVNAVRRALSAVKGGGLSARAPRAAQVTLIVSDVVAGRESDVASGPTLPPAHDSPSASEVVERYGLASKLPAPVTRALGEPGKRQTNVSDTAKTDESRAAQAHDEPTATRSHYVLLDNDSACEAAAEPARSRGFVVEIARDISEQNVSEGAALLASRLVALYQREGVGLRGRESVSRRGVCLISGGEFACPVRGAGTGGRNSETALRCAFEFERVLRERSQGSLPEHLIALCAGTDGIDGNSPAAGAFADEATLSRARALGLDAAKFLDESDAYTFFDRLGDAIVTGATATNVRDLRILLAT
jgi:glycerate 2-kinase